MRSGVSARERIATRERTASRWSPASAHRTFARWRDARATVPRAATFAACASRRTGRRRTTPSVRLAGTCGCSAEVRREASARPHRLRRRRGEDPRAAAPVVRASRDRRGDVRGLRADAAARMIVADPPLPEASTRGTRPPPAASRRGHAGLHATRTQPVREVRRDPRDLPPSRRDVALRDLCALLCPATVGH